MSSRSWRLAAVVAFATLSVCAAIVASSASSAPEPARVPAAVPEVLAGIPERRGVLGDPSAPITVTEFVDPQCPACAAASEQILPALIEDHVRPGRVKLDAQVLHFLGPDSIIAARYAAGARQQDKLWPFLGTFFAGQGPENSGYVTEDFLEQVAGTAGADAVEGSAQDLAHAKAEAQRLGITGTPTFVVRRPNGREQVVDAASILQVLGP